VLERLRELPEKYTGQVRVNFWNGGVRAIEWGVRLEPPPKESSKQ
jgi:hypothetical protein